MVVLDEVTIDLHRHAVTVAGRSVTLTRKEFQVLALLASSGGAVCTRNRIVAEVWGRTWAGANRTLDVHIATLRTKLGPRATWCRPCAASATGSACPRRRTCPTWTPEQCAPGCW